MPIKTTVETLPPFPGGGDVDIAPLETIDLARLLVRDPAEVTKLLKACIKHGFFYLDLQTSDVGRKIMKDEQEVLRFMETYFAQSLEKKMLDDRQSFLHGFKPVGTFTGAKSDYKDCYETLKVARAEMLEKSRKLPEDVKRAIELFESFMTGSHSINFTLLECLSDALGLIGANRFEESHRDGQETNTCLVMLHYPKSEGDQNLGHNKHTDIGSITLLFSEQWGLQVFAPETQTWKFIQPRPHGHATINVGDSLRFLSGKKLNSCVHRVIPPTGDSQLEDRYSIAYFLRPENDIRYEDADGKKVSAAQWHDDKYIMFGTEYDKQERSTMLTGGMEMILGKA
ncbi:2OG-Fe-II oxygenase family oxidoreductase [Collybia nuda]|uniref:2OG-Fe-II oxygenase family oxidoreductase n=1 Tax=Collybia nuda TaxID=64659 RepID=A0A9P5XX26_9AGAR|nr:2OG-Fe-II oxygenase family oxidoreductase [Collybia nuda]